MAIKRLMSFVRTKVATMFSLAFKMITEVGANVFGQEHMAVLVDMLLLVCISADVTYI